MLSFPNLDPVALHLGPLAIRWYALAYIAGIVGGYALFRRLLRARAIAGLDAKALEDSLMWIVLGVILGGRLGYVLFYKPSYYFSNPLHIPMVWEGGMSFHGGMAGVIIAVFLFCRKRSIPFWPFIDTAAVVTPIGLFFGRLANFVNGELFGRTTSAPWGMIFPRGGNLPRHPSQLYEAGMEGILLFLLLYGLARFTRIRAYPAALSGLFLIGYASARMVAECFREPDEFLGFIAGPLTMGQLLCTPMMMLGACLLYWTLHARRPA